MRFLRPGNGVLDEMFNLRCRRDSFRLVVVRAEFIMALLPIRANVCLGVDEAVLAI